MDRFAGALAAALDGGGVGCVQLRLKDAGDDLIRRAAELLAPIAQAHEVAFIMNDRPDLAAETDCDGVHIGQQDTGYAEARRIVGADAIVGVTCHTSRHLAMAAAEAGADYVAFGAFFESTTKRRKHEAEPGILEWWQETMTVPCVAIGGIDAANAAALAATGVDFLAVCNGVWAHPDGPRAAVAAINAEIESTRPS